MVYGFVIFDVTVRICHMETKCTVQWTQ